MFRFAAAYLALPDLLGDRVLAIRLRFALGDGARGRQRRLAVPANRATVENNATRLKRCNALAEDGIASEDVLSRLGERGELDRNDVRVGLLPELVASASVLGVRALGLRIGDLRRAGAQLGRGTARSCRCLLLLRLQGL